MRIKAIITLVFVFQAFMAFSQSGDSNLLPVDVLQRLKNYTDQHSEITIQVDTLIENNYYKHKLYNQKDPGVMGYRIRIFRDSGINAREKATVVRSSFLNKFEDVIADMKYVENTDWVIYVGNCRTRTEVLRLYERVKKDFPYSFIVSQKISVTD